MGEEPLFITLLGFSPGCQQPYGCDIYLLQRSSFIPCVSTAKSQLKAGKIKKNNYGFIH